MSTLDTEAWSSVCLQVKPHLVQLWNHEYNHVEFRAIIDEYGGIEQVNLAMECWKRQKHVDSWIIRQLIVICNDGMDHVRRKLAKLLKIEATIASMANYRYVKKNIERQLAGQMRDLRHCLDEFKVIPFKRRVGYFLLAFECGVIVENNGTTVKTWAARLPNGSLYDRRVLDTLCTIGFDPFLPLGILQLISQYCDRFDTILSYGSACLLPCDRDKYGEHIGACRSRENIMQL